MNIEDKIFQRKRPIFSELEAYGFSKVEDGYHFETDFMNGDFRAIIHVSDQGEVMGTVIDKMNNEEYIRLRSPDQNGAYVCSVRSAYEELLSDIASRCCKDVLFVSEQANRIADQICNQYGNRPDFPWKEDSYQTSGIFRHTDTKKWYGLIMHIKKGSLDKTGSDREIDILNLKINEKDGDALRKEAGIYPAYHMNHKLWISIILDDTQSDSRIMQLVGESYRLTGKSRARG